MGDARQESRVQLEINLAALKDNYRKIKAAVAPCGVIAVLKANAYGLGVGPIAEALAEAGADAFGVAEPKEALPLMKLGLPVQILGSLLPQDVEAAVEAGIILAITDLGTAQAIDREAARQGKKAICHFLVDTGMGRLGILASEAEEVIRASAKLPNLTCEGIYSHFPVAYREGSDYTRKQLAEFNTILQNLAQDGITFSKVHIANSDAVNNFPETYQTPFNFVRTGINLHGSFDVEGRRVMHLKSILTLKTRLAAVRLLPKGTRIGYGCSYMVPHPMRVGTIAAGYADGMPLALSNRGYVLIQGQPCHIIGRVSMDYTTVSLEPVPDAQYGDEVICLGGEGPLAITVDDWVQLKGTHAYDIICSFGSRVRRCYLP